MKTKSFLLFIFIFINSFFESNAQVCAITDRDALIALYNATDGPNWVNNANWNTAAPLNTWFGITTNASGCVTSVDLNSSDNNAGSNNLTGSIPIEIGDLQSLELLDLSYNNLTGTLPIELTSLLQLQTIDLGFNALSGNINTDLGSLTNLQVLDLSVNQLTGGIPASVSNLSNLEVLWLNSNQLSGDIPFSITTLINLTELQLNINQFSGFIYPEYGNLINLERLYLSSNLLIGTIPTEIGNLTNLISLSLGNQDLTGTLPPSLSNLVNLTSLFIQNTLITGSIPPEYGNFPVMYFLTFYNNNLTGVIPPEMENLTTLGVLDISENQLEGSLPDFFTSNPGFNYLRMFGNQFQFGDFENQFNNLLTLGTYVYSPQAKLDIVETINATLGDNITLSTTCSGLQNTYQWYKGIYPSGTLLTGETNADLILNPVQTTDAGEYYCLVTSNIVTNLTLVRNQITLNVLDSACAAVDRNALVALYNATDGNNWVNSANWNTTAPLNTWYGVTTNTNGCVTAIDLNSTDNSAGSNNLTGILPVEIGDFQALELLDLAYGNISGTIPNEISNLTNLNTLNLASNSFTGTIDANFFNTLQDLIYLNFGSNQLSGDFPISITGLNNLQYLALDGNQFSGDIPLSITSMLSLEHLFLSINNFTGFIYPEYGNLTNLISLDLSSNELTGSIPTEIGDLVNLRFLQLGGQDLTGNLPMSLGNLLDIRTLSIQGTLIDGTIPSVFGNFPFIAILYLNNNNLDGAIPAELGNINTLSLLSFAQNNLEGTIPDFTVNTNLNFFWLHDNQFQFGDFENQFNWYTTNLSIFDDNPQANVNLEETITDCENNTVTLTTTVSGSQNTYQWYKGIYPTGTLLAGETNADLVFNTIQTTDEGDYYCLVNSTIVTDLTLVRNPIHVEVSNTVTAYPIDVIEICDNNNDGFASFTLDIPDIESQVIGSQTDVTVSYYDALGNLMTLTNPFTNTTANSQIITVRLTNSQNCYDDTILILNVNPTPDIDTLNDETICDSYTLPVLTNGNYYTQSSGMGTLLNAGDIITTSQTIFIYSEQNGCSAESDFTITINQTPVVDILTNQTACDSYMLQPLTNGNYFTASNGNGTQLNAGDSIENSQTLYIYNENTNCSSESSFTITINQTPSIDVLNDEIVCDTFVLQSLTNGNYYTQSNGMGTQLNAGETLTTSQTIYIYIEQNGCFVESSFNVTINPSTDFTLSSENVAIAEGDVTISMTDNSITYEYSLDGFSYQSSNQFSDLIDGIYTLYVRDSNSCIEKSLDFSIELSVFYIPKFFTPNGDTKNERWRVVDNKNSIKRITIYNRYGKVLTQLNPSHYWDGTYNGALMPSSDYWYAIELNNGTVLKGHFSLKR